MLPPSWNSTGKSGNELKKSVGWSVGSPRYFFRKNRERSVRNFVDFERGVCEAILREFTSLIGTLWQAECFCIYKCTIWFEYAEEWGVDNHMLETVWSFAFIAMKFNNCLCFHELNIPSLRCGCALFFVLGPVVWAPQSQSFSCLMLMSTKTLAELLLKSAWWVII